MSPSYRHSIILPFCVSERRSPLRYTVADRDPKKQEHDTKLRQACTDAITLAAFMTTSLGKSEEIFTRYFRDDNADFFKSFFGAVAHYENPDGLDGTNHESLTKIMTSDLITNPNSLNLPSHTMITRTYHRMTGSVSKPKTLRKTTKNSPTPTPKD